MAAPDPADLQAVSILVVEDTFLVADMIAEELTSAGCHVVGPVARLRAGLTAASVEALDGAFLDVNLAGEHSFPIADVLTERGIPFAFLTGYGDGIIPPRYRGVPRLSKPFELRELTMLARRFKTAT
jgi:DNA-binding response OmpR family regulator